jgi:hypothetical protein
MRGKEVAAMLTMDPGILEDILRAALGVVGGLIVAAAAGVVRKRSAAFRLGRIAWQAFPFVAGAVASVLILLTVRPAVLSLHALATGSGVLGGDDAELLNDVDGLKGCSHRDPKSDALAELACMLDGPTQANVYRFAGTTEMSAWFEKLTLQAVDGKPCEESGRTNWTSGDDQVRGQIGCTIANGAAALWWTTSAPNIGGQLVAPGSDYGPILNVWRELAFSTRRVTASTPCASASVVGWDDSGVGHDAWPSSTLVLSEVAPCTTVMVSSAAFDVPGGPSCIGGPTKVCVLVWSTQRGGRFEADGLADPGSWWSYTHASPRAAIDDKADQFNARGWFARRNCTTGIGCQTAEVWVVNDGATTMIALQHP